MTTTQAAPALGALHLNASSRFAHLAERHSATLQAAYEAVTTRKFYARWQESPSKKFYGETAAKDGEAAFKAALNKRFEALQQTGETHWHGEEHSPYGFALGVEYPVFAPAMLADRAGAAKHEWRSLSAADRALVLVEALERASALFFTLAYATQHTSGQGFGMAFQATGPHSFERALEVVVVGLAQQMQFADSHLWSKPSGGAALTVQKQFVVVPKGIGLVVGCSTFPIWNTLPGLFASLVTGNPVIVKPHPASVLPIAMVVASMQETLRDLGLNPHIVQFAADASAAPLTRLLAELPEVSLIDFTGGGFGDVIEEIAAKHGKIAFTEKAGVNAIVLESASDLSAALDNIARTLTLYSGQMCTTSQNLFVNRNGVRDAASGSTTSVADVGLMLKQKIDAIMSNPAMASGFAGAIQSEATHKRVEEASALASGSSASASSGASVSIVRASEPIPNAEFADARTASPLVLQADAAAHDIYEREWFGPISFIIPTESFDHSMELVLRSLKAKGALTTLVYTTDAAQRDQASDAIIYEGKAPVAFNYTGDIFVNQSAAYSDFHGAGANPAGTASFSDVAFVANRFNVIGVREVATH
jgi:phenylacetic acid degradation protein paaN